MKLNAKLSFDLIAVEQEDTVHVLLELTAPTLAQERQRPPATLQVVLDRSGSMADGRLHAALQAVHSLVGRLRPEDRLGLVVFDDQVSIPVAAGPVGDGSRARAAITSILPGGMTNLSSGLLRGIQEAQRVANGGGATLVLLSDGHANQGVIRHEDLERFAAGARAEGITSSTIGIGLGYDEDLLAVISRGGAGDTHFAAEGDSAGAALASEADGLLANSVQAASLTVRPAGSVGGVRLFNDLPATSIEGGFMVELGDLHGGETRRLMLEVDVPALSGLGLAQVCELELRWVDVESMRGEVATMPVHVNVVPGDQAAGRVDEPEVATELAFQRVQRVKREATDALRDGRVDDAAHGYRSASKTIRKLEAPSPESAAELAAEVELLDSLAEQAYVDDISARKQARADDHMKSRRRGRHA
jgi:Ca-activated chloride channel family protein